MIAWGRDRDEAIDRMLTALEDLTVEGLPTTAPALSLVLAHPEFRAGRHWTTWLEEAVDLDDPAAAGAPPHGTPPGSAAAREPEAGAGGGGVADGGPWAGAGGVAAGGPRAGAGGVAAGGAGAEVADFTVAVEGTDYPVRLYRHRPSGMAARAGSGPAEGRVPSPLAGTLSRVEVAVGDHVAEGALLAVVEAMKMETPVRAPFAGTVVEVPSSVGGPVAAGQIIVLLEAG